MKCCPLYSRVFVCIDDILLSIVIGNVEKMRERVGVRWEI